MDVYDQMKVVVSLMCSGFVFGFAIIDVKHRSVLRGGLRVCRSIITWRASRGGENSGYGEPERTKSFTNRSWYESLFFAAGTANSLPVQAGMTTNLCWCTNSH